MTDKSEKTGAKTKPSAPAVPAAPAMPATPAVPAVPAVSVDSPPPPVLSFEEVEEVSQMLRERDAKRLRPEEKEPKKRIPTKTPELRALEALASRMGHLEESLAETRMAPPPLPPVDFNWATTSRTVNSYQAVATVLSGTLCVWNWFRKINIMMNLFLLFKSTMVFCVSYILFMSVVIMLYRFFLCL